MPAVRNLMISACVTLMLLSGVAMAQSVGGSPYVAVHGHAEVQVVPDTFPLSIDLQDEGMDVAKAQSRVEELTRLVLDKARQLGVADLDIEVGSLAIDPQQRYDEIAKKQVFTGNRYSRSLLLKFRSLANLRAQVAAMPTGKNVQVSTMDYEFSGENEATRKLLVDAIADARKSADVLATGIDRRVLGAQTISTSPMALSVGSYINSIDVTSTESTTILTAEQIRRLPVGRNVSAVALLAPGTLRSDIILEAGAVTLQSDVYILYLLGDR
jgi:uncharacterized protein YggE